MIMPGCPRTSWHPLSWEFWGLISGALRILGGPFLDSWGDDDIAWPPAHKLVPSRIEIWGSKQKHNFTPI